MEDLFEAMPGNYYTRHALGMLCVGVMMLLLSRRAGHYYVEGVGYATIMEILRGSIAGRATAGWVNDKAAGERKAAGRPAGDGAPAGGPAGGA